MHYHANAKTNLCQRGAIQASPQSCRQLARRYHVSPDTISRWKRAGRITDGPSIPRTIHYALDPYEQALVGHVRKIGRLNLNEIVAELARLFPHFNRSNVYRTLRRQGLHRLPKPRPQPGRFSTYPPGYLHIDLFYLPRLEGKRRYCFVAIDRATRLLYLRVYERKSAEAACDFLARCVAFFPFRIHRLLTDNGKEFTLQGFRNRWGATRQVHPFRQACQSQGIRHRTTKVKHPWTNGLVENAIRQIQRGTVWQEHYPSWPALEVALERFQWSWNLFHRHRSLGGKRPYQVVLEWYEQKESLFTQDPTLMVSATW